MRMPLSRLKRLSTTSKLSLLVTFLLLIAILVIDALSRRQEIRSPTAVSVSALICGANIDHQISTSTQAQALAKRLGVQTIRMGDTSNGAPPPAFYSKVHIIKGIGLVPLIILHGGGIADPARRLTIDIDMVNKTQQIFGGSNAKIYYELGNENDLNPGMSASSYTAMWNALIPSLKPLAPNSWFGGPVNFQQNPSYISYFVHNANPKPDFISWHEYTCGHGSPASFCIQHIDNWTTHIGNTKSAIKAKGDPVPPIMITEWNYSPFGISGDGKSSDPTFLRQWTTKALQTLGDNNVFAAYHFNVEGISGLVDSSNKPTVQGQAFQAACQHLIGNGTNLTPTLGSTVYRFSSPLIACAAIIASCTKGLLTVTPPSFAFKAKVSELYATLTLTSRPRIPIRTDVA